MSSHLGLNVVKEEDGRIRVAIVINTMTRGGAERQVFELLRGIDRSRFNPTLVVFNNIQDAYPAEAFAHCRTLLKTDPAKASFALRAILLSLACYRLTKILRECRAQVVHAFLPKPSAMSALACRLLQVPVFIVGRRSMALCHRRGRRVLQWADRFPMRFATAIVGNCNAIAEEMVTIDHFSRNRALTVYNGVDTERFNPEKNQPLRSELGFQASDFVFGIVANFYARKRHIDFVRAAREICECYSHAKFLIIGEDQGTLCEIREYLTAHSLLGRCVIITGTAEPEQYYACMDCYVSTSEVEGLSNAILEAMSSALPVIATNVGGTAEIVRHGESGFLVAPCAPAEIAQKARWLIEDRALCARMGRCGRAIAETKFSLKKMIEAHECLYTALLLHQPDP